MSRRSTLIKPPPEDESKSPIENVLQLTPLNALGPDIYTNTRPLWLPPGARGIFGGAAIAQSLSAAQQTVLPSFSIHSMHCYFALPGDSETPIVYHVERVRDGKSFATRTVQARQLGKPVFTTTMSFMRDPPDEKHGHVSLRHQVQMPAEEKARGHPPENAFVNPQGPFESRILSLAGDATSNPHARTARHWLRAKGKISEQGGLGAQISALAYVSDSFFIGTVARVHDVSKIRFGGRQKDRAEFKNVDEEIRKEAGRKSTADEENGPEVSMMVSLDHSIYFHAPRDIRADEWMFGEIQTPWAGNDRGLVMQSIFSKEGKLLATCIQEGLIRLKQEDQESKL